MRISFAATPLSRKGEVQLSLERFQFKCELKPLQLFVLTQFRTGNRFTLSLKLL
jgi:hypothetical protein